MTVRPPLRLHATVEAPNGTTYRWGLDEPNPENVPSAITFSTTMPGGFEQASMTLPRQPSIDYNDLQEFSTITVRGAGGQIAWQGRLETTPRTSGQQLAISPAAVGWQAALDDRQDARMIYIDIDLTKWQPASTQIKTNQSGVNDYIDPSVNPDQTTGLPSLATVITSPQSRALYSTAWYDAKGIPIGALYYAWKRNGVNVSSADTNNTWIAFVSSDDLASSIDNPGELRAAGPGTGAAGASTLTRLFASIQYGYSVANTSDSSIERGIYWTFLGVVGTHSLTLQGAVTATGGIGFLASDIVQHAVSTWASVLATSRGGMSTIQASTFVIPHLAFTDPTTASNIIKTALQYGLPDWWVDTGDHEQPTFNVATRDNHGNDWQARVGPSGLQETGPQVDRLYNSVVVSFNDVTGIKRTVGPTGSGANTIDNTLADSDPANPVTAAGLTRRFELDMGIVSTVATATLVGQTWLAEQKLLSTAGQAQLVGHVQDASGIWHPAWQVRAGDRITFVDAHDPVPRRIVRTSYTDSTKTNQLDLDSPPQGLQALLARFTAADTTLGQ